MIEEREFRARSAAGEPLINMSYVRMTTSEIGEHVVTNGMDRIFPRDLPIGTVSSEAGLRRQIHPWRPSARLEEIGRSDRSADTTRL